MRKSGPGCRREPNRVGEIAADRRGVGGLAAEADMAVQAGMR